ncbi:GNAT family N-acetyltransferase [Nocardioides jishulii]|uniref:GNAT family N-acetyltransferase n=1 Tax=Nocardioides jishulii TaxID=2575440 RepID=A0A4U2YSJ1_9ACTN|nr:GNAT family N-acetyltransferase [Nocardioides jishulii]QCX28611.1 GNAT family N-acetyltransferase [Nocardioides jishulii]TKI64496.1 GNAT family N-acetyltransferase [Nocardioides jishulii]
MTASGLGLRIERLPITHPDAARLVDEVQGEYVVRYGGQDESPVDPTEFLAPHGAFLVGYVDDVAVATAAWRWVETPDVVRRGPTVELKRMYVVAAWRNRGLARAMLAAVEADARAAGAASVVLETGLKQPEAMALYLSSGYREIAGFGHYADEPLSRAYAKEW